MRSTRTLRALIAAFAGVMALMVLAPAAHAQYPPSGTITLIAPVVNPGDSDEVVMTGCAPGATATFEIEGVEVIGSAVANAEGVAEIPFTVPSDIAPGTYTVTGRCLAPDGEELVVSTTLTVVAPGVTPVTPGSTGTLPRTGADYTGLLRVGALLVLAGGLFAIVARKRTRKARLNA